MVTTGIKIVGFDNPAPGRHTHMFMCPGCGYAHCFSMNEHGYNGNRFVPTLNNPVKIAGHIALYRCECTITSGRIKFSDNCTHGLRGMEMQLPDVPIN